MSSSPTQKKLIEAILEDFKSNDNKVVLDSLARVKSKGDVTVVPAMIELYASTNSEEVKDEVRNLLSQTKIKESVLPLIEGLLDGDDEVNEMILFSLWHANLNPINYIAEIVDASCKGSYLVALEGLTVIENLEGPFSEEVLIEANIVLTEYFQNEDEKSDLIKSILGCIRDFDNFIAS